jgi:hypothetical protein
VPRNSGITPVRPAPRRLRQEDLKFKGRLDYIAIPYLKRSTTQIVIVDGSARTSSHSNVLRRMTSLSTVVLRIG